MQKASGHEPKAVVVILFCARTNFLQLRDATEDIVFPGCWRYLGGSISEYETSEDTAILELLEELECVPDLLHKFER